MKPVSVPCGPLNSGGLWDERLVRLLTWAAFDRGFASAGGGRLWPHA